MKKKHTGTQIVAKLRQADVLIGQGKTIPEVCKEIEVSEQTYYRWRQKYGGMSPEMVKELRGLQLGWIVNHKRVYRIWRQGGLRIPQKRGKKKHHNGNGLNACDRHPPEYINHIWSYDIMEDKLENGRKVRILNVIDEFTRECLVSEVAFSIKQHDVIELLRYLFLVRGCPAYLRSDNGSQFTARRVKRFLKDLGVDTLFVEPGSPWENGYAESFNSRMRDELLDGELFLHIDEMKYVVERWRMDYNHYRPHSSLGYMTPAGFAGLCRRAGCIRPHTPVLDGVHDCGILS